MRFYSFPVLLWVLNMDLWWLLRDARYLTYTSPVPSVYKIFRVITILGIYSQRLFVGRADGFPPRPLVLATDSSIIVY